MSDMLCPKCGAKMVLRTASQGNNAGNKFWGCSQYGATKCKGTLPFANQSTKNDEGDFAVRRTKTTSNFKDDVRLYIPFKKINARALYKGLEVKFIQTMGLPYSAFDLVNKGLIKKSSVAEYSRFRVDYNVSQKTNALISIKDQYELARKILNRGRVTVIGYDLDHDLKAYFNIERFHEFDISVYDALFTSSNLNFDVFDSLREGKFYTDTLRKAFGHKLSAFVTPQIHLDSLISDESALSDRRIDFLVHTSKADIVIELDGDEHKEHASRDKLRDSILIKEGFEVRRFSNSEVDAGLVDLYSLAINEYKNEKSFSNEQKYLYMAHVAQRIQVTIVEILLLGSSYKTFSVDIDNNVLSKDEFTKCLTFVQNDLNHLLSSIYNLFNRKTDVEPIKLVQYTHDEDTFLISIERPLDSSRRHDVARVASFMANVEISHMASGSSIEFYEEASESDLRYFLRYLFRKEEFRSRQLPAIQRTLKGLDTLVLLPTGAGKSIAFQMCAMLLNGVSIVIDPIISLINDQIDNLSRYGIDRVGGITSEITSKIDKQLILNDFQNGEFIFTYIAPERLQIAAFRDKIKALSVTTVIPLIAIDEAHCVSEWGHDFRTSYLNIGRITRDTCATRGKTPCIIGLTGTASNSVLKDVQRELAITDFDAIITPDTFDRTELSFDIKSCESDQKRSVLTSILDRYLPSFFNQNKIDVFSAKADKSICGIVFCPHVNGEYGTGEITEHIRTGVTTNVNMYSTEKPKNVSIANWVEYKSNTSKSFKNDEFNCLVATKAFGMGIDKPNIQYTVHYGLPASIESFYQEAGRAGRNRVSSRCLIIGSVDNEKRSRKLLNPLLSIEEVKKIYDDEVSFSSGDDISRVLYFHLSAFKGISEELAAVNYVLSQISDFGKSKWINVSSNYKSAQTITINEIRMLLEKAIYRLVTLGIVKDYTIDYANNEFHMFYEGIDKDYIIDSYAFYVSGYSRSRVNRETALLQEFFNLSDRDFVIKACEVLIGFIYDTVEKGRRRALNEVLQMYEEAKTSSNPDETIRKRIINYLETTYSEEIERILSEERITLNLIRDLIEGHETSKGEVIGGLRSTLDAEELRGQVSRYLESNPDQPILLMLRAITEMFSSNCDIEIVNESFESAFNFAQLQLGFSIDNDEFYHIIAWTISKFSERNLDFYKSILMEMSRKLDFLKITKYVMQYAATEEAKYLPAKIQMEHYCYHIIKLLKK